MEMTFKDALKLIEENKHLIGKKFRGATIDEFIIAPTDSVQYKQFEQSYLNTLDAQMSILPFINYDVEVFFVSEKKYITQLRLFLMTPMHTALNSESNEISE